MKAELGLRSQPDFPGTGLAFSGVCPFLVLRTAVVTKRRGPSSAHFPLGGVAASGIRVSRKRVLRVICARTACSRPMAACRVAEIPFFQIITHAPNPCGARTRVSGVHGNWNAGHVCKRGTLRVALSRSPWGLRGARRGWITAPSICRTGGPTNGVARGSIARSRNRSSMAGAERRPRVLEPYNAQWIVEKNGYLSPAQAVRVAHRDVTQARRHETNLCPRNRVRYTRTKWPRPFALLYRAPAPAKAEREMSPVAA